MRLDEQINKFKQWSMSMFCTRLALSPGEACDILTFGSPGNCSLVSNPGLCCFPTVAVTPPASESLA